MALTAQSVNDRVVSVMSRLPGNTKTAGGNNEQGVGFSGDVAALLLFIPG